MTFLFPVRFARLLSTLLAATLASFVGAPPARAQGPAGTDLSISMVDAPDPVAPGKVLTYRITIAAKGARAASNVSLQTSVPAGTTFVEVSGPSRGWTFDAPSQGGTGNVTATTASLPPGRAAVFQLSVRVAADAPEGSTISNTATVAGAMTDPNPNDNSAATTTTVRPLPPPHADLSVTLIQLQDPVTNGGTLIANIRVENKGPMAATDVTIRTSTPTGTVFVSAPSSAGRVTSPAEGALGDIVCELDALPADRLVVLTAVLRVTAAPGARIETLVTAVASSVDPDLRDNGARAVARVVEPGPAADVSIAFSESSGVVVTNADLSYTAVARNDGPTAIDVASGIITIPRGGRFISAVADRGETRTPPLGGAGTVGWRIGALGPSESATLTITVRVGARPGAPLVTRAIVTSRAADPDLGNNAAFAMTRVQSLGDAVINWEPPDLSTGDAPPPTNVVVDPTAAGGAAAKAAAARADGEPPICYNVYVSDSPDVQTTPENLYTTVPANETTTTAPVAPGGSFFTVTAEYTTGESSAANEDGAGDQPGANLTSVKVTSKVTAKGSGFTDAVDMLLDGIPFADAAKVKSGNSKAVQKGILVTGETVEQYMASGTTFLVVVRNDDGGVSTWEYEK